MRYAIVALLLACGRPAPVDGERCELSDKGMSVAHPDPTRSEARLQCSRCNDDGCLWTCYGPPGECGEEN